MSGSGIISKRDRENYLIKLKKEFAYAGVSIPELLILNGEHIRLRQFTLEITRKKGNITPDELAEADHVAALVRKERNAVVKKIGSADDLTKEEADNLFKKAAGLSRALDTLGRAHEPKTSVTEASQKAKLEEGRRWLSMVRKIYDREIKRDGFQ
jgi:predicted ATPase